MNITQLYSNIEVVKQFYIREKLDAEELTATAVAIYAKGNVIRLYLVYFKKMPYRTLDIINENVMALATTEDRVAAYYMDLVK